MLSQWQSAWLSAFVLCGERKKAYPQEALNNAVFLFIFDGSAPISLHRQGEHVSCIGGLLSLQNFLEAKVQEGAVL